MAYALGKEQVECRHSQCANQKNLDEYRKECTFHPSHDLLTYTVEDLVFDCPNRLVHLLTVYGTDSVTLFAYEKNMKSIKRVVDTRSLVTRLYIILVAIACRHQWWKGICGGDYTYSSDIRISTLDFFLYQSLSDEGIYRDEACSVCKTQYLLCLKCNGFISINGI